MKIEDLVVGNEYINSSGKRVKLLCIGGAKIFAKESDSGEEYSLYKEMTEIWTEVPKEPKKLGRLCLCTSYYRRDKIFMVGEIRFVSEDIFDEDYFKPVTVNEKGEVFEIL